MAKLMLFALCTLLACAAAQRITTIQLDGVQYFVSRMNPYSPELNYFLAYQYCRSLGLQLASFETNEKVKSMTTYLQNAGYSKYDFWTSGNRLGTGMFLWMSTGLPFNATFDYFENSADSMQTGLLDPVDHNANTAPQRTARDSSSGLQRGCVVLKAPSLKWAPEDCSAVKDFICEQTRCYYYNYGSIPVSSAQGRPIYSTTTQIPPVTSTPLPMILSSTYASLQKIADDEDISEPSLVSLKFHHEQELDQDNSDDDDNEDEHIDSSELEQADDEENVPEDELQHEDKLSLEEGARSLAENEKEEVEEQERAVEVSADDVESPEKEHEENAVPEEQPVEERLKQIAQQIKKLNPGENTETDLGHQSFLSLNDLIKNLNPNDKKGPQIDSDYSNTMRVLGEPVSVVINTETRNPKSDN